MTIKDVLLPLMSFPVPTGAIAIENAVALAGNLGAQVSAVAFEMDMRSPVGLYADPLGVQGMFAADRRKSAENARRLVSAFETIAVKRGIVHDHMVIECAPLEIPRRLAAEARFRDISILALKKPNAIEQRIVEQLVFESGRPVLIFDEDRALAGSFANVAIAWDASPPAARAVADAMPLLQRAKEVRVFTVVDEKPIGIQEPSAALAKHLSRHGVEAVLEDVKSGGRPIGLVFEAYVDEHKSDLLVMGAYGHSRMREFILGGATNSMISCPPTCVLLSH